MYFLTESWDPKRTHVSFVCFTVISLVSSGWLSWKNVMTPIRIWKHLNENVITVVELFAHVASSVSKICWKHTHTVTKKQLRFSSVTWSVGHILNSATIVLCFVFVLSYKNKVFWGCNSDSDHFSIALATAEGTHGCLVKNPEESFYTFGRHGAAIAFI